MGKNSESSSIVSSTRTNVPERESRSKESYVKGKAHIKQKSAVPSKRDIPINLNPQGYMNFLKKEPTNAIAKSIEKKYGNIHSLKHRATASFVPGADQQKRSSPIPASTKDITRRDKDTRMWVTLRLAG